MAAQVYAKKYAGRQQADGAAFAEDCVSIGKKPATITRYIATIADRDGAVTLRGSDTMPRRGDPVGLHLKDVTFMPHGSETILIHLSKTERKVAGDHGVFVSRNRPVATSLVGECPNQRRAIFREEANP